MLRSHAAGFTLIELGVVLVLMSIVVAIGAGAFGRYNDHLALEGATQSIASRLTLTRERAMATRLARTMKFAAATQGYDYRVEMAGVTKTGWRLPARITYAWLSGTINSATYTSDGRCSASGLIILQDPDGARDTVSVLASGLILTQ